MLFFYFNYRQLINGLLAGFVLLTLPLRLLLGETSYHLEYVVIWVEALVVIAHKITRRRPIHRLLHSQKLMATKQILKLYERPIDRARQPIDLQIDQLLLVLGRHGAAHPVRATVAVDALALGLHGELDAGLVGFGGAVLGLFAGADDINDKFRSGWELDSSESDVV